MEPNVVTGLQDFTNPEFLMDLTMSLVTDPKDRDTLNGIFLGLIKTDPERANQEIIRILKKTVGKSEREISTALLLSGLESEIGKEGNLLSELEREIPSSESLRAREPQPIRLSESLRRSPGVSQKRRKPARTKK